MESDSVERFLLARVANMYYEDGFTQQEIADLLGISRVQVVRKLKKARETGIVRIIVDSSYLGDVDTARHLKEAFGLRDALVVPSTATEGGLRTALGKVAANYVSIHVKPGSVVGIAWGRTLRELVINLPRISVKNLVVTNIIGGLSMVGDRGAQELALIMSRQLGGRAALLSVPFRVDTKNIKDALLADTAVAGTIRLAKGADIILVGVGSVTDEDLQEIYKSEGLYDLPTIEGMKALGAAGELIGRYYDRSGQVIPCERYENIVGLDLCDLKNGKTVLAVAGGERKVPAILGALRGGFINALVTDEGTAQELLRQQGG